MLQLKNNTPFSANIVTFPNEHGIDSLYVIVKATFIMGQKWSLAEEQVPPQKADEYWGEPGLSSIKALSDFHIGKLSTDILMYGNACAPNHQSISQLDVHLTVGEVQKTVRVFGDRQWKNGTPSAPIPFQSMPLVYERAFGGQYQVDESTLTAEERNLVGSGFAGKRSKSDMNGVALPNVEDPNQLIQHINDTPSPASFSPTCSYWSPRNQWAGTYDDIWQETRAPYLPKDFDKRFLNAAHPDLIYPTFIKGGEPILIKGMHPAGDINLSVPYVKMSCNVKMKGKEVPIHLNVDTLALHPNEQQLTMVWLAPFQCDKNLLKINEVELTLSR